MPTSVPVAEPDTKMCEHCGAVMHRPKLKRYHLSNRAWALRKFCGAECFAEALRQRNRERTGPRIEVPLPESSRRVATVDGLPARCDRCDGLWRPFAGGVSCQNGHNLFVTASLARAEPTAYPPTDDNIIWRELDLSGN